MLFGISVLPWWVKPALFAIALSLCFGAGWYVQGLRWSKAEAKWKQEAQAQSIKNLQTNLETTASVQTADAKQASKDAKTLEEMERIADEIISKASSNVCFGPDAVERLRKLWPEDKAH